MNYTGGYYGSGGYYNALDPLGSIGIKDSQLLTKYNTQSPGQYLGVSNPVSNLTPNMGAEIGGPTGGGINLAALGGLLGGLGGQQKGPEMMQSNHNRPQALSVDQLMKLYKGALYA